MSFLDNSIWKDEDLFFRNRIRFQVIGNISDLPRGVTEGVRELEEKTAFFSDMHLQLAFSYSSREEIVRAARAIVCHEGGRGFPKGFRDKRGTLQGGALYLRHP